ncbi:uncharacterized protein [Prorops nasuta]|uniref:uncharacterized protein n=1 Tax=Prorops nasuta TaxID=863751 RepID=UPI0034CDEBAD
MTFKTLMNNFGYFANHEKTPYHRFEHFHTTPGIQDRYHHSHHGHGGHKGKGASGAALSALTLLAFLFLMNVMQQSLQENNNTTVMGTTAVLLRDEEEPVSLITIAEDKESEKRGGDPSIHLDSTYGPAPKITLQKEQKQQRRSVNT